MMITAQRPHRTPPISGERRRKAAADVQVARTAEVNEPKTGSARRSIPHWVEPEPSASLIRGIAQSVSDEHEAQVRRQRRTGQAGQCRIAIKQQPSSVPSGNAKRSAVRRSPRSARYERFSVQSIQRPSASAPTIIKRHRRKPRRYHQAPLFSQSGLATLPTTTVPGSVGSDRNQSQVHLTIRSVPMRAMTLKRRVCEPKIPGLYARHRVIFQMVAVPHAIFRGWPSGIRFTLFHHHQPHVERVSHGGRTRAWITGAIKPKPRHFGTSLLTAAERWPGA